MTSYSYSRDKYSDGLIDRIPKYSSRYTSDKDIYTSSDLYTSDDDLYVSSKDSRYDDSQIYARDDG